MLDIWQLGVTLYSLVFGVVPFYDSNIMKLYERIQHDEHSFPKTPEISPLLKDLLCRMLQKNPQNRITLPEIKVSFVFNRLRLATYRPSTVYFVIFCSHSHSPYLDCEILFSHHAVDLVLTKATLMMSSIFPLFKLSSSRV